jgi:hypothetical protein
MICAHGWTPETSKRIEQQEKKQIVTRADELKELAINVEKAIQQARRLNLPTSAYILSMVSLEVSQALKAAKGDSEEDAAR